MEIGGKRAVSKLVGWKLKKRKGFLFFEPPQAKNGVVTPLPGEEVTVNLGTGGSVFGLSAVYIEPLKHTGLLLFATEDETVISSLLAMERFSCFLPVQVTDVETGVRLGEGMVFDIGLGGIAFYSTERLDIPAHNAIKVSFHIGEMGHIDSQLVKVSRIKATAGKFEYYGSFVELNKPGEEIVLAYLEFCRKWLTN